MSRESPEGGQRRSVMVTQQKRTPRRAFRSSSPSAAMMRQPDTHIYCQHVRRNVTKDGTMDRAGRLPRDDRPPLPDIPEPVHRLLDGVAQLDHDSLCIFLQQLPSLLPPVRIGHSQRLFAPVSEQEEHTNGL